MEGDLGGQREHDVEVADRQQVGLLSFQPGACRGALAPGTMPVATTAVVGNPPMPAVRTGFDLAAERSGAAGLDRGMTLAAPGSDRAAI